MMTLLALHMKEEKEERSLEFQIIFKTLLLGSNRKMKRQSLK